MMFLNRNRVLVFVLYKKEAAWVETMLQKRFSFTHSLLSHIFSLTFGVSDKYFEFYKLHFITTIQSSHVDSASLDSIELKSHRCSSTIAV